uniref:protein-export membrane protein SecG n=1 Tax=Neustupella aerophytica TaxID=2962111 RepID=UPI00218200BE|nr:protein-export membrane protein SecG [Neustupella aerophytica]UVI61160.1 protein-export membrane protein SecG [Neustupella aerophytica]
MKEKNFSLFMNILLNVMFFLEALMLGFLVVTRSPARLPGFEKTRNKNLDGEILRILITFLLILLAFKCR